MTFGQARARAEKDLRVCRAIYRRADTLGEKFERNLDRLINKRKTIVTWKQIQPLYQRYEEYGRQVLVLEAGLLRLGRRLRRYEIR